jgi:SPP1 gp7 family putative phage head morphogenesis protein
VYRLKHGFALGRKTTLEVTKKVRDTIGRMMREGAGEITAGKVIADMGGWAQSYGRTVYRTNLASAYTKGRFAEARDPDIAEVIGAFEYNAILDSGVRANHRAAHGLVAATNDPLWHSFSPPLGFNCRCSVRLVDRFELSRRRLLKGGVVSRSLPSNFRMAGPDTGFMRG